MFCGNCSTPIEYPKQHCDRCGTPIDWRGVEPSPVQPSPSQKTHLLVTWKTSIGFTTLGILIGPLALSLLGILALLEVYILTIFGFPSVFQVIIYVITVAVFPVLSLIYALRALPSYFGAKPLFSSSKTVSFLNGFFGGVIFGCWWNGSLTDKRKNSSHLVFAALLLIVILIAAFRAFASL